MNFNVNSLSKFEFINIKNQTYKIIFKSSLDEEQKKKKIICNLKKIYDIENKKNIIEIIKKIEGHFFFILWSKNFLFCTVDHVCSYPLIYSLASNRLIISDNKKYLREKKINQINLDAINLSGYGISNNTNYKNYNSLKPCEYIFLTKSKLDKNFWFSTKYNYKNKNINANLKFDQLITNQFLYLKKKSDSYEIIVPLSAGIDSRFIVSGLKYFEIKNFKTFTYGSSNLRDFKIADQISNKINIENKKIFITFNDARKIYTSKNFEKYLKYRDLGISSNNPGDYFAINKLTNEGWIKKNSLIINGQAGDFISGNHIPNFLYKKKKENLNDLVNQTLNFIIFKHYNLWSEMKLTQKQMKIKKFIHELYFKKINNFKDIIESYETFEYENRQIKWVVGQQKVYDYFNLSWTLPLWDRSLIDFFYRNLTIYSKINQKFYKEFLIKKNMCGVWREIEINPKERFKLSLRIVRFFLKCIFFFISKKKWHIFERKFINYFTDPAMFPAMVSYSDYVISKKIPRNIISFISKKYVKKYKKNFR